MDHVFEPTYRAPGVCDHRDDRDDADCGEPPDHPSHEGTPVTNIERDPAGYPDPITGRRVHGPLPTAGGKHHSGMGDPMPESWLRAFAEQGVPNWAALQAWNEADDDASVAEIKARARQIARDGR